MTERSIEYAWQHLYNLGLKDIESFEQLNVSHPKCLNLVGQERELITAIKSRETGAGGRCTTTGVWRCHRGGRRH